jgi:hypothetical protein
MLTTFVDLDSVPFHDVRTRNLLCLEKYVSSALRAHMMYQVRRKYHSILRFHQKDLLRTSDWDSLYVEATRQNMILPDLPAQ